MVVLVTIEGWWIGFAIVGRPVLVKVETVGLEIGALDVDSFFGCVGDLEGSRFFDMLALIVSLSNWFLSFPEMDFLADVLNCLFRFVLDGKEDLFWGRAREVELEGGG